MELENKIILLPEPCKASWSKMYKVKGGRFCDTCNKKVQDFRGLNQAEIIHKIATAKSEICGKFDHAVIHQPPIKMFPFFYKFKVTAVIAGLIVFLISACKTKLVVDPLGIPIVCNSDTLYMCNHKDVKTMDYAHKPNIHEEKYKGKIPCNEGQKIDDWNNYR